MSLFQEILALDMRFWGAVAVQLLAIVLREHSRLDKHCGVEADCQPVEVNCTCSYPEPVVSDRSPGLILGSVIFGIFLGALLATIGFWLTGCFDHAAIDRGGRRRGGGVLS